MKFWARQVIRLSDGHSWTGSLQRHHVCMCEHAYMCFSLSLPTTPQVLPFLCFPPPSVQRFPEYWPVAKAGSCCQCTSCVLFLSSRVTMCFACLAIWACTAACPVLWGRPWCQASLPVKTFWVAQNPRHLGWCYGRVTSFIFSPQCYFVLNTIDTPGAFDVKIMKKLWRNGTDGRIAFSFLPSGFPPSILGSHHGKDQGFSQEYLRLWKTSCSLHSQ